MARRCRRTPERCTIGLERRTLPGETAADIEAEVARIIGDSATQRTLLVREPFAVDSDAEIVRAVSRGRGRAGADRRASYWADAAFIAAAGIPTVMYGASGDRRPRGRGVGER